MKFADFQASSTFELDGVVMSACEKCRMDYAERTPPGPPCESCRVELVSENEDAAEVYMMTRWQYVTRHNGKFDVVVDISIPAVESAMRIKKVRDQEGCLNKVRRTFHHFLDEMNDAGS